MDGIDWTSSMQQTFEFYKVNPDTWTDGEQIKTIKGCTINRDLSDETLGSATFDGAEMSGEFYIRAYLIAIQNKRRFKEPLGTYLMQTNYTSYTGKQKALSIEAYTPLIELKEKYPPVGFALLEGEEILSRAVSLTRENVRAPVIKSDSVDKTITNPAGFVSEIDETWLSFLTDLLLNAERTYDIDAMGNILFSPIRDISTIQPRFTFDDGNSSILYPEITMEYDLYNIPNVVEVVVSKGVGYYISRVVNDEPTSPISTVTRGREIVYRTSNPEDLKTTDIRTESDKKYVDLYAESLLKSLSSIQRTVSYKHGYCPVRVGDCVRLNYQRADMKNIKAVITSQSISCEPGCPVTEKAVYFENLWR